MRILKLLYPVCFNIFISVSLIFSPVVYSAESGNSSSAEGSGSSGSSGSSGGGGSGHSSVILPGSNMGRVSSSSNPNGGTTFHVDFNVHANPGRGNGGDGSRGGNSGGSGGGSQFRPGVDARAVDRTSSGNTGGNNSREKQRERERQAIATRRARVNQQIKEFQEISAEDFGTNNGGKRKKENTQILQAIERAAYRFQVKKQVKEISNETQQKLDSSSLSWDEKIKIAEDVIQNAESFIRRIVQNPDMDMSYPVETKKNITEKDIQIMVENLEMQIYEQTLDLAKNTLESQNTDLKNNIQSLNDGMELSLENPLEGDSFVDINSIYEILKDRYDRSDLEILKEEKFILPEEEPYEFLSSEGEFLDKNKAVYEKLRNANPYHEQGILARKIGLSAVEVADEEFAEGNEPEAETAFQTAEFMSDIALGILPYVGVGKDAYELVVGRHLLTGRNLTLFERSMSSVGLILASISGGTLSSGVVKLSVQKISKVFGKINKKHLEKTLRGLNDSQLETLKEYQTTFFQSLSTIGLNTKTGIEPALKFVNRAFARENPLTSTMDRVIRSVGKEGMESYTRALDDLSRQLKSENLNLPELGEIFLARQLRFKHEIATQTKKIVNEANLVQIGKIYAKKYNTFVKGVPEGVFKGRVWRGVNKKYGVTYQNLFKYHTGMDSHIARYTVGERAIYTSLKEETAIKEIINKTDFRTPEQVKQAYLVGQSKHIETDKVLDLTDTKTLRQLSISRKSLIETIQENSNAYDLTQIIGHIARNKGFKGIVAPAAVKTSRGKNFISFLELE